MSTSSGTGWTLNFDAAEVLRRMEAGARRGVNQAARDLAGDSAQQAPTDSTDLINSQVVTETGSGGRIEAGVSYDTPYAVIQHERLTYRHGSGSAKFLERPAHQAASSGQVLDTLQQAVTDELHG